MSPPVPPRLAPQGLLLGSHSPVGTAPLPRAGAGPAQLHTQTPRMQGASSPPYAFPFSLASPLLTQGDHTVTCPLEAEQGRPPTGCGDGVESRTGGQGQTWRKVEMGVSGASWGPQWHGQSGQGSWVWQGVAGCARAAESFGGVLGSRAGAGLCPGLED